MCACACAHVSVCVRVCVCVCMRAHMHVYCTHIVCFIDFSGQSWTDSSWQRGDLG